MELLIVLMLLISLVLVYNLLAEEDVYVYEPYKPLKIHKRPIYKGKPLLFKPYCPRCNKTITNTDVLEKHCSFCGFQADAPSDFNNRPKYTTNKPLIQGASNVY